MLIAGICLIIVDDVLVRVYVLNDGVYIEYTLQHILHKVLPWKKVLKTLIVIDVP